MAANPTVTIVTSPPPATSTSAESTTTPPFGTSSTQSSVTVLTSIVVSTTTVVETVVQQPSTVTATTTAVETVIQQPSTVTATTTTVETVTQQPATVTATTTALQTVTQPASTVTATQTLAPSTVTATASPVTVVMTQTAPASTVTAIATTTVTAAPPVTAAASVIVDSAVHFVAPNTFELTGSVQPKSDVVQIEFYDEVRGQQHDLGAAALGKNGSFTFDDAIVPGSTQGFISAVATDSSGHTSTTNVSFALGDNKLGPRQEFYDPQTGAYEGVTFFYPDGQPSLETKVAADGSPLVTSRFSPAGFQTTDIFAGGQTVTASGPSIFNNNGAPETEFVFNAGHGASIINKFRVDGTDHDTLNLPSSDFQSIADVLAHTEPKGHSSEIHDPVTGDTVLLVGVTKDKLGENMSTDFKFHT